MIGKCGKISNRVLRDTWQKISTDNLSEVSDFEGYQSDFLKLFGFGLSDVNYDAETDPIREIDLVQ